MDIIAGIRSQIKQLKDRLKSLDTGKHKPSEIQSLMGDLEALETRYDKEKSKRDEKRKAKEQAVTAEAPKTDEVAKEAVVEPVASTDKEATPKCAVCGQDFKSFPEFQKHREEAHGPSKAYAPMDPAKKKEVVKNVEDKMGPAIIGTDMVHPSDMEKESKFDLDAVVEPIRGTPGSKGRVMRHDGPKDLVYVMWQEGPMKDKEEFGGYYPQDLKKNSVEVKPHNSDPEQKCVACEAWREKETNTIKSDLRSNYDALLKDLKDEREAHYNQGNMSWVARLDQKITDLEQKINEKFPSDKQASEENGSGGTERLTVKDFTTPDANSSAKSQEGSDPNDGYAGMWAEPDGRDLEAAPGAPGTLFTAQTAPEVANRLKSEIDAPYVNTQVSTLGGEQNVTIMMTISTDPKESWSNGILHNSRYGMFAIHNNGVIEHHSGSFNRIDEERMNFRKRTVKSVDQLIQVINQHIEQVRTAHPEGDAPKKTAAEFGSHGNGKGLNDLYVLPASQEEAAAIMSFLKEKDHSFHWVVANVQGHNWYGKSFLDIPFGESLQPEIEKLLNPSLRASASKHYNIVDKNGKKVMSLQSEKELSLDQLSQIFAVESKKRQAKAQLLENIAFLKAGEKVTIIGFDKIRGRVKFASAEHGVRGWAAAAKFSISAMDAQTVKHGDHDDKVLGATSTETLIDCSSSGPTWVPSQGLMDENRPPATPESLNELESAQKLNVGDRVQVSDGSGVASGITGIIVSQWEFNANVGTNERGVPNVNGHYKPVDWSREVPIKLDDGSYMTMFKNRLMPIEQKVSLKKQLPPVLRNQRTDVDPQPPVVMPVQASVNKKALWQDRLQNVYDSVEDFRQWDEMYGLKERLGFPSVEEAWEANPMIQGSTKPADFKRVSSLNRKADYEGWSNYDTWGLALWLDNDQDYYNESREMAKMATDPESLAKELQKRFGVAGFHDIFTEQGEKDKNINDVNWLEVSNDLFSEAKENEEYDRSEGAGGVIDKLPTIDVEKEKDTLLTQLSQEKDPAKRKELERRMKHLMLASLHKQASGECSAGDITWGPNGYQCLNCGGEAEHSWEIKHDTKKNPQLKASLIKQAHIRHEDGKWIVYNHDYTKKLGTYGSKEEAVKRLRQIEYFKHQGSLALSKKEITAGEVIDQALDTQVQSLRDRMSAVNEVLQSNTLPKQAGEGDTDNSNISLPELVEDITMGLDLLETKLGQKDADPELSAGIEQLETLLLTLEKQCGIESKPNEAHRPDEMEVELSSKKEAAGNEWPLCSVEGCNNKADSVGTEDNKRYCYTHSWGHKQKMKEAAVDSATVTTVTNAPAAPSSPAATTTSPSTPSATTPSTMPTCALCGGQQFSDYAAYQNHMEYTHASDTMPTSPSQKNLSTTVGSLKIAERLCKCNHSLAKHKNADGSANDDASTRCHQCSCSKWTYNGYDASLKKADQITDETITTNDPNAVLPAPTVPAAPVIQNVQPTDDDNLEIPVAMPSSPPSPGQKWVFDTENNVYVSMPDSTAKNNPAL